MQSRSNNIATVSAASAGDAPPLRPAETESCVEIIRVLPTVHCFKRSPTLDGSIPLRAAQSCKPFLDGNAAGFHLRFAESAMIERTPDGAALRMTDDEFNRATADYDARIAQIITAGYLTPGGYWHRELEKGFAVSGGNTLRIFTGLLARPMPGVAILVSRSLNRRCPVGVREYVIPDDAGFVPVFLDLDLSTLAARETWLDVEFACLTPLQPGLSLSLTPLAQRPEIGQTFADFYSDSYFDSRSRGHSTGQYRDQVARAARAPKAERAYGEVVVAGPETFHALRVFDSFATASGYSATHPQQRLLPYAEGGCPGRVTGSFDGRAPRQLSIELEGKDEELRDEWSDLYGEPALGAIEQWIACAHSNSGPISEPYLVMQPWILASMPAGWSVFLESYDIAGLQGMRGVLASDSYHGVLPLWLPVEQAEFEIAAGAPIVRIIPVPRQLLKTGFRELALT